MLKKTTYTLISTVIILFALSCQKLDIKRVNKVYTDSIHIGGTSLKAYGKIVDISDNGITKYGFCFGAQEEPSIFNSVVEINEPSATGQFSSLLDNITFEQPYYIRAFASNEEETVYGNIITFNIQTVTGISVTTNKIDTLTLTSVKIAGSISNLGSVSLQDFGHCWSKLPNPTINDNYTSLGSLNNDSAFSNIVSGLDEASLYYFRTYAKLSNNSVIYGNSQSVIINDLEVSTDSFSVAATTATIYGTIVHLGIIPVTDYGFCWSYTTSQPSLNDNKISLGAANAIGQFHDYINNLVTGITYYYRAYATDGSYVKYGTIKNFTK